MTGCVCLHFCITELPLENVCGEMSGVERHGQGVGAPGGVARGASWFDRLRLRTVQCERDAFERYSV